MAGMCLDGGPGRPRLERLFGFPLRHDEVPLFTFDGTEQLKAEKARRVLDRMRAVGEPLLQLGACVRGHLDRVDLHHWHGARLPCRPKATMRAEHSTRSRPKRAKIGPWPLIC